MLNSHFLRLLTLFGVCACQTHPDCGLILHIVWCRWDKNYSACYLDDMPHNRLTRPVRVFEWFFDGVRKGHGRETILRLEVRTTISHRERIKLMLCCAPPQQA